MPLKLQVVFLGLLWFDCLVQEPTKTEEYSDISPLAPGNQSKTFHSEM